MQDRRKPKHHKEWDREKRNDEGRPKTHKKERQDDWSKEYGEFAKELSPDDFE